MTNLSTITKKHQITIPAKIMSELELQSKDKVLLEKHKDWIKVKPLKKRSFLDLYGSVETRKKIDFKKLRKQFEKEVGL